MRQIQISNSITNREAPSLESYFTDIARYSLISMDDEVQLAQKIRQGDRAALNRLVNANLRFVVSVAKKYQNQGLALSDLINEGNLGLIKAAEKFDETRGFKFISFAVWWIREGIMAAINNQTRMVRLPLNHVSIITKINNTISGLENRLERQPTNSELAEWLNIDEPKISDARYFSARTISYDAPLTSEDDFALVDRLEHTGEETDSEIMAQSFYTELKDLLGILSEKERQVVEFSFGLGHGYQSSVEEIARVIGYTPQGVRNMLKASMRKLKKVACHHQEALLTYSFS